MVSGASWYQELHGIRSYMVSGATWYQELHLYQELNGIRSYGVSEATWYQELHGIRSWNLELLSTQISRTVIMSWSHGPMSGSGIRS
jgi:hypothetical protein